MNKNQVDSQQAQPPFVQDSKQAQGQIAKRVCEAEFRLSQAQPEPKAGQTAPLQPSIQSGSKPQSKQQESIASQGGQRKIGQQQIEVVIKKARPVFHSKFNRLQSIEREEHGRYSIFKPPSSQNETPKLMSSIKEKSELVGRVHKDILKLPSISVQTDIKPVTPAKEKSVQLRSFSQQPQKQQSEPDSQALSAQRREPKDRQSQRIPTTNRKAQSRPRREVGRLRTEADERLFEIASVSQFSQAERIPQHPRVKRYQYSEAVLQLIQELPSNPYYRTTSHSQSLAQLLFQQNPFFRKVGFACSLWIVLKCKINHYLHKDRIYSRSKQVGGFMIILLGRAELVNIPRKTKMELGVGDTLAEENLFYQPGSPLQTMEYAKAVDICLTATMKMASLDKIKKNMHQQRRAKEYSTLENVLKRSEIAKRTMRKEM